MSNKNQHDEYGIIKGCMSLDKPTFQDKINMISLKTIGDTSGNISILESGIDLPFDIKRIFYIWNTKTSLPRGGHAHKELIQCFIAMHGNCDLIFKNGNSEQLYHMKDASKCLIAPPGYWLDIANFSADCVLLVIASEYYDEQDYIRNYKEFLEYVQSR
ncbi:MAG: FdtA/QdtA family cupin domain-containing protein [Candidatus Cloacimonetes bacterium]|jgi:hypothetical protein|nr:FdtA/QdtA family cupin domain-containing protein [Candidatus Cloacimonadota bacterium]